MRNIRSLWRFMVIYWVVGIHTSAANNAVNAGPLDRPLTLPSSQHTTPANVSTVSNLATVQNPNRSSQSQAELRRTVAKEQAALERLDRETVKRKAENGERAAQVVLGADYAKEATLLSFAPLAANDALSDAARWYSLAASRGFPGAPSLDQAGVRFYPIRVYRELRR